MSAAEEGLETCAEPLSLQVRHWSLVAHRATGPGFPSQRISLALVLRSFSLQLLHAAAPTQLKPG